MVDGVMTTAWDETVVTGATGSDTWVAVPVPAAVTAETEMSYNAELGENDAAPSKRPVADPPTFALWVVDPGAGP
jgi:hypothetical protein